MFSPAEKVFALPELLEAILLQLPHQDLIVSKWYVFTRHHPYATRTVILISYIYFQGQHNVPRYHRRL